jgi:Ca2+-binding EF-hand superfamily protein
LKVFKTLDKDGNGYLSSSELVQIMAQLGQPISIEEADAMVYEADLDGDGHIAFHELLTLVRSA